MSALWRFPVGLRTRLLHSNSYQCTFGSPFSRTSSKTVLKAWTHVGHSRIKKNVGFYSYEYDDLTLLIGFLFVIYPLICFNAAVALAFVHGWFLRFFYWIRLSKAGILLNHTCIFVIHVASSIVKSGTGGFFLCHGCTRSIPSDGLVLALRSTLFPNDICINIDLTIFAWWYVFLKLFLFLRTKGATLLFADFTRSVSVSAVNSSTETEMLCLGSDWYRFPGHYLLPNHGRCISWYGSYFYVHGVLVRVGWIEDGFDGMLPKYFPSSTFNGTVSTLKNWKGEFYINMYIYIYIYILFYWRRMLVYCLQRIGLERGWMWRGSMIVMNKILWTL